jgi:hypothetical protein
VSAKRYVVRGKTEDGAGVHFVAEVVLASDYETLDRIEFGLRVALKTANDHTKMLTAERDQLAADNKRLREALQDIYNTDPQVPHPATDAEISMGQKMCIYRVRTLVKAALSSGKEQPQCP